MVSTETTVGTYSGFGENLAPTVVFTYRGPVLPTVVFSQPQADTVTSFSGLEARRRRKIFVISTCETLKFFKKNVCSEMIK